MKGKGRPEIAVSCFGQECADEIGFTLSVKECYALSLAWSRVSQAIQAKEYGEVIVLDRDGDEILCVGLDYGNIEFDEKDGLPLIQTFDARKI